jgi:hypothetical protein
MSADDFIFTKMVHSKCASFDKIPLSRYIVSLSALGFPSAASLGTLKSPAETIGGDRFLFESFTQINNRVNPVAGCYINFVERETGKTIVLSSVTLNYEYLCTNNKQ